MKGYPEVLYNALEGKTFKKSFCKGAAGFITVIILERRTGH